MYLKKSLVSKLKSLYTFQLPDVLVSRELEFLKKAKNLLIMIKK